MHNNKLTWQEELEIYAYPSVGLIRCQETLGEILDYAVNELGYDIDDFMQKFIDSEMAFNFSIGQPYIRGRSSVEIVKEVVKKTTGKKIEQKQQRIIQQTKEYWTGWVLAFYQWRMKTTLDDIFEYLKPSEIIDMYRFHLESEMAFVREAEKIKEIKQSGKINQMNLFHF